MRKIAYIRVSTADQRHDRQIDGLKALCDELHIETLSACAAKRPVYDQALRALKPGDMLVVWDLDRAFRSVVDALTEAEKLRARGVHFRIANLNIDTSTPAGSSSTPCCPRSPSSSGAHCHSGQKKVWTPPVSGARRSVGRVC